MQENQTADGNPGSLDALVRLREIHQDALALCNKIDALPQSGWQSDLSGFASTTAWTAQMWLMDEDERAKPNNDYASTANITK